MKKTLVSLIFSHLLVGCASFSSDISEETKGIEDEVIEVVNEQIQPSVLVGQEDHHLYAPSNNGMWQQVANKRRVPNKNINHYARGIMQELLSNLQYVGPATPVAIADFVYLNSNFNESDLIGQQLSEAFTHEVHKLGIPVVEYKLTDYIRVTANGDFALSKDYLELSGDIPIRYVLTGTLVKDRNTTIVNARIVGVQSKAIVASAQGVLPNSVTNDLTATFYNDGLTR